MDLLEETPLDEDPDTVDGMSTQEIFVDNLELRKGNPAKGQFSARMMKSRVKLREKLRRITEPILEERITPYVRMHYKDICDQKDGRRCTPCYSLIRRYRQGQRRSHGSHRDGHAIVTVVVSLTDYGVDYRGGLYVASANSDRRFIALRRGDGVVHRSDLLHGVKVFPVGKKDYEDGHMERWSWILWFVDSETCEGEYGYEWYRDCAMEGNPTCEFLYANKIGQDPSIEKSEVGKHVIEWNTRASDHGHAQASVKMARAFLKTLPSVLPKDVNMAAKLFKRAIQQADEPDAHYGLARMYLTGEGVQRNVTMTVYHLEQSAKGGHVMAMFNLGIAHLYGYSVTKDSFLAGSWFKRSGLPEGLYAKSVECRSRGSETEADAYEEQARNLGYGLPWRKQSRKHTGSGGAGGVDLNLPWPKKDGFAPLIF